MMVLKESRKSYLLVSPNLLVNGASGIAVGMATNIPPHNLTEVINGVLHLSKNPDVTIAELMEDIQGPDFPTAGLILGKSGIRRAYETGRAINSNACTCGN